MKEIAFPLGIDWVGGRRVVACVPGKPDVVVAPPAEFGGSDPGAWSPEDLLVAAAAGCLAVTFTGLVERSDVHLASLRVAAEGTVGRREDGRFGFVAVNLRLHAAVGPDSVEQATKLADEAGRRCLVASSLAFPVTVDAELHALGANVRPNPPSGSPARHRQ